MEVFPKERGDGWGLWIRHDGATADEPCGPRLLKVHPPRIQFTHATLEAAQKDAALLKAYIEKKMDEGRDKKKARPS